MNVFAPDTLFRLGSFQHAELFSGSSQAWEALARLPEYLRRVLRPGINGDVADGAHIGHASAGKTAILLDRAKAPHFANVDGSCWLRHRWMPGLGKTGWPPNSKPLLGRPLSRLGHPRR